MHKVSSYLICLFLGVIANSEKCFCQDVSVSYSEAKRVIESICEHIHQYYVLEDKAQDIIQFIQGQYEKGRYTSISDPVRLAQVLSSDLKGISQDAHLGIAHNPERARAIRQKEQEECSFRPDELEREIQTSHYQNSGFYQISRLQGNIGYLDLRFFESAGIGGDKAVEAMRLLQDTEALIIDLRKNQGGSPSMVQFLCSYFFNYQENSENRSLLFTLVNRSEGKEEQYWTLPYLPGALYDQKKVYILTGKNTFSAAESFAYALKNQSKAILVGDTTAGGAHPGSWYAVADDYIMFIPVERVIDPITFTDWEGCGVLPDIPIAEEMAFDRAYLEALTQLEGLSDQKEKRINWEVAEVQARLTPVRLQPKILKEYAGDYEDQHIIFKEAILYYLVNGKAHRLIPLASDPLLFSVENQDRYRLRFATEAKKPVLIKCHINGVEKVYRQVQQRGK